MKEVLTLLTIKPYAKYLEVMELFNGGENLVIFSDEIDVGVSFANKLIDDSRCTVIPRHNSELNQKSYINTDIKYIGFTGDL